MYRIGRLCRFTYDKKTGIGAIIGQGRTFLTGNKRLILPPHYSRTASGKKPPFTVAHDIYLKQPNNKTLLGTHEVNIYPPESQLDVLPRTEPHNILGTGIFESASGFECPFRQFIIDAMQEVLTSEPIPSKIIRLGTTLKRVFGLG